MKIDPDTAAFLLHRLRTTRPFADMPVTNRPEQDLWRAFDGCLLQLRLPLYHSRLGKPAPKSKPRAAAIQAALALLAAFARTYDTHQAIVTARDGWVRAISFQPRPEGLNWTAEHALHPVPNGADRHPGEAARVSVEDLLHLAAKAACAIGEYQPGAIPVDFTATLAFTPEGLLRCAAVLREHRPDGRFVSAELQP